MGSNNLSVEITADVTSLQQKFAVARAEAAALSSEMNKLAKASAAGTLDTAGQSQFAQIAQQYLQAKTAAAGYSAQIRDNVEANKSFGDSIDEARGKLSTLFQVTGAAAALEALRAIADGVLKIGERATQIGSMSEVLGVTVEQFQTMGMAADEAGVSAEVLFRATEMLVKSLDEARDGSGAAIEKLKSLGITTQDIADPAFGAAQVLQTLSGRLNDTGTKAAEMSALTEVLGARAILAAAAIEKLDLSQKGVGDAMAKANGLSAEQTKRLQDITVAAKAIGTWFENAEAKAVLFAEDVIEQGPAVASAMAGYTLGIQKAAAAQAQADAARHGTIQRALTDYQLEQGAAILSANAITKAQMDSIKEQIAGEAEGSARRLELVKEYAAKAAQYYGASNVDKVKEANAQLLTETRSYNSKQLSEDQELQSLELDLQRQSNEIILQNLELHKQMSAAAKKDAEAQLAAARESVVGQLALQEQLVASTQNGAGGGNQQAAAAEIALTVQELEAWASYYQKKAALANGDAALLNDIDTQRLAKLQELDGKILTIEASTTKTTGQQWMNFANTISGALDHAVQGMLARTQTWKQSMLQMSSQLAQGMISNLIKVGIEQATQAATGLTLQRSAQQQAVMMDAKKAAAGAYSSASSIPYIGWIIGPIAAAAAFAAVEGFSAEGGWDIPAGMNPMTQLHAREMVLPAEHADVIRNMADGGAAGGGGATHNHTWNVSAMDVQSFRDVIHSRGFQDEIAASMRKHFSRGGR